MLYSRKNTKFKNLILFFPRPIHIHNTRAFKQRNPLYKYLSSALCIDQFGRNRNIFPEKEKKASFLHCLYSWGEFSLIFQPELLANFGGNFSGQIPGSWFIPRTLLFHPHLSSSILAVSCAEFHFGGGLSLRKRAFYIILWVKDYTVWFKIPFWNLRL